MRPLTDGCPKPLLGVRGQPLMLWSMQALARGGFRDLVVNTAWLEQKIVAYFGASFPIHEQPSASHRVPEPTYSGQLRIAYSREGHDFGSALETAGGIVRVLPKLGDIFWVLAGDIFAPDFVFSETAVQRFAATGKLAHLWLVPNPAHHPHGDFGLAPRDSSAPGHAQLALGHADVQYTYSTIGLFRPALFAPPYCDIPAGNPHGIKAKLAPMLRAAMDDAQVTAELYTGEWTDVGTPERLAQLKHQHPAPT